VRLSGLLTWIKQKATERMSMLTITDRIRLAATPTGWFRGQLKKDLVFKNYEGPSGTKTYHVGTAHANWVAKLGTEVAIRKWGGDSWMVFISLTTPVRAVSFSTEAAKKFLYTDREDGKAIAVDSPQLKQLYNRLQHELSR